MIEVNHRLLSGEALDNLLMDVITRQSTDYGDFELTIANKKWQLMRQLDTREAVIIYCPDEDACDIIAMKNIAAIKNNLSTY